MTIAVLPSSSATDATLTGDAATRLRRAPARARPGASCGRGRSARAAARELRRMAWQSAPGSTSTCAESAGSRSSTVQTCRSCTSTTSGTASDRPRRPRAGRSRGRALEEDPRRLAQQRPARPEDQPGDDEARDRVEAVPAGREDERARDRGAGERGQVGGDVQESAADVEALAARRARAARPRRG